eukprot:gene28414-31682_t
MRTGAKAFVNQDFPEGVNRQVNITGTPVQVKAAAELVKLIIDQGPTAIHINSLSGVIGTSGAVIKDLQSKSGARIQIDQDFPPDVPRKINITGTSAAVSLAVNLVQNILNGVTNTVPASSLPPIMSNYGIYPQQMIPQQQPIQQQYGAPGGEIKQSIEVPKAVVGKIIGKGGETITLIQRKSSAKVTVDQSVPDGMPCKVIMSGNAQSLGLATQMINEIMMGVPSSKIGANLPTP